MILNKNSIYSFWLPPQKNKIDLDFYHLNMCLERKVDFELNNPWKIFLK